MKVVYDGLLINEGHDVLFQVDDDSVLVTETYNGNELTPTRLGINSAIDKQQKLIDLGYCWI